MKPEDKIHIVIADDHALFRKGLMFELSSYEDFIVDFEADDGIDLIEKIRAAPQKPDICILDLSMPRMNGYDALVSIKKQWPQIRVVILSTSYNEYTIIKRLSCSAGACLPKEISGDELLTALRQVYRDNIYNREIDKKILTNALLEKNKMAKITANELSYLNYACSELTHREIAYKMCVTNRSVDGYRDSLCNKLGLKNRVELVIFALSSGIVAFKTLSDKVL